MILKPGLIKPHPSAPLCAALGGMVALAGLERCGNGRGRQYLDLFRRLRRADRFPWLSGARRRGSGKEPRRQGDLHLPGRAHHSQPGRENRRSDRGQGERHRALRIRRRIPPMSMSPPRAKEAGIAFGSAAAPPAGAQVRDPNDIFLFRTGSDEKAAGALTAQTAHRHGRQGRRRRRRPAARRRDLPRSRELRNFSAQGRRESRREFLELTMDPGQQSELALQLSARPSRHRRRRRASAT